MESKLHAVQEIVMEYLERWLRERPDSVYEHASNIADCIFYALGISDEEQAKPPQITMPRRLPIVDAKGKRYFLDMRLKQYRNVENPFEFFDF